MLHLGHNSQFVHKAILYYLQYRLIWKYLYLILYFTHIDFYFPCPLAADGDVREEPRCTAAPFLRWKVWNQTNLVPFVCWMCRSTNADDRRVFSDGLLEEFHMRYDTRSTAHSGFVLVQCLPPNYFLSTGSIGSNGEMKRAWVHFNSKCFYCFKYLKILLLL